MAVKLSGSEALQYLRNFPQLQAENLRVLSGGEQIMQDPAIRAQLEKQEKMRREEMEQRQRSRLPGLLGMGQSLVEGIVDPFASLARAGGMVGESLLQGKSLNQSELKNQLTRGGLGLASLLVPGGVIAKGIGGGLLGSLSQQKLFDEKGRFDLGNINAEELGLGALTGGALGGVLGKLGRRGSSVAGEVAEEAAGQAPGRLQKLGRDLQTSTLGINPAKTPTGFSGAQELRDQAFNVLKGQKQPVSIKGIDGAYKGLLGQLDDSLSKSKSTIDTTSILDDVSTRFIDEGVDIDSRTNNKLFGALLGKVDKTGGSPKKVAGLIRDLDGQLKNAYNKIDRGNPLTNAEQIRISFRQSLSRNLKDQVPEASNVYSQLQTLQEVAPDAVKTASRGSAVPLPFVGAFGGPQLPTGNIPQRITRNVGRAIEGIGNITSRPGRTLDRLAQARPIQTLAQNIPTGPAATSLGSMATGGAIASELQRAEDLMSMQEGRSPLESALGDYLMQQGLNTQEESEGLDNLGMMSMGQPQAASGMDTFNTAMELIGQGFKPNEALKFAELLAPQTSNVGGRQLPAGQVQQLNDLQSALTDLQGLSQQVEDMSNRFGPVQGGAFGDFFGSTLGLDPERAGLKSRVNTLAQRIGKALEGGKLTDADIDRYRAMLPQLTDPPAVAQAKLQDVASQLQNQIEGQIQGFQQAGYNPYGGGSMPTINQDVLLALAQ